ncbi:tetratricopeptide repeat protein [Methylocella tundrae]|uniref:Sel1 repeat family protein n=1 Tax=Methylocella tundrae TaxID=227605 RepID=A0A4U8Z7D9_METTU|nr:tetratricopeptide repeat protein [Methylocella tundrae]WPP02727.1 tetratricopeptide repeat protein [Methylocella tundrae]VFU17454.1 protein of unknown function [Methylocella tundrae]
MRPIDFQKFIADEGYILAPDFAKKRKALKHAARRGDAAAQCSLGTLCLHGYGVPQNLAAAAKWFEKAANQGDCNAQFFLGEMYWGGEGIRRDVEQAAKWFRRAASQGDVQAQRALAILGGASDRIDENRTLAAGAITRTRAA